MKIQLRPATFHDADLLLALRNDPDTRANSLSTEMVPHARHLDWLIHRLTSPVTRLYVAERIIAMYPSGRTPHETIPVGTGRLDLVRRDTYELSLTVAPEMRGQGIGRAIIEALVAEVQKRGGTQAVAVVKLGNVASLRAFVAAGFDGSRSVTLVRAL